MVQNLAGCARGWGLGVLQITGAWSILSSMETWVGCCFWKILGCQWVEGGRCVAGLEMHEWGILMRALARTSLLLLLACPGGASHPCSDHGVCMDGMSGSGKCRCRSGFAGTACELCAPGAFGPHCQGVLSFPSLLHPTR